MTQKRKKQRAANGFTLVELMVVLAIIGLLTTVVVINVLPSLGSANREKARADIALFEQALEMYRIDNMTYPRTEDGLSALVSPPANLARPDRYRSGGYVQKLPTDPWGHAYKYAFPGTHGRIDIYSTGADGREGGEGDDADIGNWQ